MKQAKLVKVLVGNTRIEQKLWQLSEPLEEYDFIITSATVVLGMPETYIFGADENGTILNWLELNGSFKGECNHERALDNAEYEVAGETNWSR